MATAFLVKSGIDIPKRTVPTGIQRSSQYEVLHQMSEGQCFDVPIEGEEGHQSKDGATLSAAEHATRRARALQSYLSGYAKRGGIKVVTRWLPGEGDNGEDVLRVWHAGARDDADEGDAPDPAADVESEDEDDLDL